MKKTKETLKTRILDGAIALFIEKGVENVTTRELTDYLGISRSHVYYYFSDWQTLCLESLTRYMQIDLDEFTADIAGLAPREKLLTLVKNYLSETDAVWQLYSSLWQMAVHHKAYADLAESMIEKWGGLIVCIIDEGIAKGEFRVVNVQRTTRQLGAMLNGYSELLIVNPSEEKCRVAVEDITDFIQQTL